MKSFDSLIGPETREAMQTALELRSVVTRTMPRDAAEHLLFCRLVDGRLRLTLDHAAWVARLRFNERTMVRALARDGIRVMQVSWHVAPAEHRAPPPRRAHQATLPGAETVKRLEALADDFGAGDPLANSLRKLADVLATRRRSRQNSEP